MKPPQQLSTTLQWIAEKAKEPAYRFWTLAHHITPELLEYSYRGIRKDAAPGVDGATGEIYAQDLSENIGKLHERLSNGNYRAPAVRRVAIPKSDGNGTRPLGIPTFEDKIVQKAVTTLLEGIYEEEFYDFSYGYRREKSCHQALEALREQCRTGKQWIIDGDISDYFTSIDHKHLREFLGKRIEDRSMIRLIGKWLNAGVLEDGTLWYPERGTPQGGVVSPLLANIYLHYVLDEWFEEVVKPRLQGEAFLIRVADDFVIGCQEKGDAEKIMAVLPKRMERYGLKIHPEKTRLLDFRRPLLREKKGESTFDFLGFRHYWGKSIKGKWIIKRKTAPKRLKRAMRAVRDWCREHRHEPMKEQHRKLRQKLQGHYNYYGVTSNYHSLKAVYEWTKKQWRRWLNRRGGDPKTWQEFKRTILCTFPLPSPKVVQSALTG